MKSYCHARRIHRPRRYTGPYPFEKAYWLLLWLDWNHYDAYIPQVYRWVERTVNRGRRPLRYAKCSRR